MVNIPSFHLMAVDDKDTLTMRIGCGTTETKPLAHQRHQAHGRESCVDCTEKHHRKDMIHYFSRSYCERRGFTSWTDGQARN